MDDDKPPALCTTDGRSVADARAAQTNETGQHPSYIVLCPDERAKGFVRPYRDAYKHIGMRNGGCNDYKRPPGVMGGPCLNCGDSQPEHARHGGCGSVTTMGRALAETYARDPHFYSHTFCVTCNRHLPVAEFVWAADGEQVGL